MLCLVFSYAGLIFCRLAQPRHAVILLVLLPCALLRVCDYIQHQSAKRQKGCSTGLIAHEAGQYRQKYTCQPASHSVPLRSQVVSLRRQGDTQGVPGEALVVIGVCMNSDIEGSG